MKEIKLKIVTPEKVLYEGMVESVSFPTTEGEITVLPHHIPIISAVKAGELKIKVSGKEDFFHVTRGVLEVTGEMMTLLTDAAERSLEIDEERAKEAHERAKQIMAEKRTDIESYAEAVAQLERALSRLKVVRRRRGGRSSFNSQG
ncbi:ATP synthase F1 subunit epsilon [Candidatus Peregrinibacteria bacterium CG_4_10_14_0_2_um_filter_38_24]|nr:MAG: ATP synthase F1 subunit epsilon [Candidatus Peregrinibacteria bacterium CG_4_10_14_0_2_um_filter_38_24]PJC38897.1 MAG: ATP synthase F1 subunit epsilon [Candidatus Peregrinibacteria bacterium CG_4_9_14_0_2_um_filter_38_9]